MVELVPTVPKYYKKSTVHARRTLHIRKTLNIYYSKFLTTVSKIKVHYDIENSFISSSFFFFLVKRFRVVHPNNRRSIKSFTDKTSVSNNLKGDIQRLLLKSVRVHFALGEIAITLELRSQFLRFLDQNDRHSLGVLLIY